MSEGYIQKQANPAKRHIPIVRVSIHTQTKCYQVGAKINGKALDDPTNQVISVTTQKNMDSPVGAFTVQLIGDEWLSRIKSNDIVVIQMGYKTRDGDKLNTVMVGLVDRVRSQRIAGLPNVATTITGRDFGKILIKSQLKFYPELGKANPNTQNENEDKNGRKFFLTDEGWLTLMSFFKIDNAVKGTPATLLDIIMRYILPKLNEVAWTVWDEKPKVPVAKQVDITNILRYNFAKVDVFLPFIMTADQFEGVVWNMMERASIKPFTELFVDVRESSEAWNPEGVHRVVNEPIEQASDHSKTVFPVGKGFYPNPRFSFGDDDSAVMVVLRNTPFDKELWQKLYVHDLQAEDVLEEDLSFSDDEHYNLFWAGTTVVPLGMNDLKFTAPPLWNEEDVKRYGLSALEVQIEGMSIEPTDPTAETSLQAMSKAWSARLKAWFERNHLYWNGSMTVRGKGNYKIGQRLLRKGIEKEFYIEGVSQNFNVFDRWETSLQLTRGMGIGAAPDHKVYIEKDKTNVVEKPTSEKSAEDVQKGYYTIKRGDSLWSIAAKPEVYGRGESWTKLWEANREMLIERDKRNVSSNGKYTYPGQVLRIPKE